MMSEKIHFSLGKSKEYADEFCGDLIDLFKEKYDFTVDDIYFSGREDLRFSFFTNAFIDFCYTFARRRIEVEHHSSNQTAKMVNE